MKHLNPEHERFVKFCLDSNAVQKFEDHRRIEISFVDACRFWRFTESTGRKDIDEKLEEIEQALFELYLFTANADVEMSNGRVVTAAKVQVLTDFHLFMQRRFRRHLKLLRKKG